MTTYTNTCKKGGKWKTSEETACFVQYMCHKRLPTLASETVKK